MIERYSRPEMVRIWSDENKLRIWLKVEILACEAMTELGEIPTDALTTIKEKAGFDVNRVLEIEETVKHDVIAFLTNVAEHVGPESRYIHFGMTSSDLLDTSLAYLMRQAGDILLADLTALKKVVGERAVEFKSMPCVGRSHGIHAEPTTFGLKLAMWYDEIRRSIKRLEQAIATISVGKISGAVGTFAHINPWVESYVCEKLNLVPAPVSTQIVQRDRHAEFLTTLALIAGSLEKFATEIRNLQRTEILEVEESFGKVQKGSSAMPHKRNPILSENLTGLARMVRAAVVPALENVALWHERDISHSSVERMIAPDTTVTLDVALARLAGVIDKLVVHADAMAANLDRLGGVVYSQRVLLALTQAGLSREAAYAAVQRNAMAIWEEGGSFLDRLMVDEEVSGALDGTALAALFDPAYHMRHVDTIFERVFGRN